VDYRERALPVREVSTAHVAPDVLRVVYELLAMLKHEPKAAYASSAEGSSVARVAPAAANKAYSAPLLCSAIAQLSSIDTFARLGKSRSSHWPAPILKS
jgi:hypothetical protein